MLKSVCEHLFLLQRNSSVRQTGRSRPAVSSESMTFDGITEAAAAQIWVEFPSEPQLSLKHSSAANSSAWLLLTRLNGTKLG